MTSNKWKREEEVAINAVLRASLTTSQVFQQLVASSSMTKSDKSPVTVGDFSAQAIVNSILAREFPDDAIVGEEDADDLRSGAEDKQQLKRKVLQLANEGLTRDVEGQNTLSKPLEEEEVLKAIDRGNHAGGIKGRECVSAACLARLP